MNVQPVTLCALTASLCLHIRLHSTPAELVLIRERIMHREAQQAQLPKFEREYGSCDVTCSRESTR